MNPAKDKSAPPEPLLRPLAVASIPSAGLEIAIDSTSTERTALSAALGLAAVDRLTARYRLTHRADGSIAVSGDIEALVQPFCVVSLEPFALPLREKVAMRFGDSQASPDDIEIDLDSQSGEDPPDPIENGMIDLGRVTTEFLALALPMFPRKPDATFAGAGDGAPESPFAKLAALKPPKPKG